MSGFTTTGATVMGEIGVNQHSHALLMWRQLTQWLGGMGIIVLMVAILPDLEAIGGSLATLGNIGPAFGRLGPFGSYLLLPDSTKLLMVFLMWAGRLEIIPVLVVLTGPFWKQ